MGEAGQVNHHYEDIRSRIAEEPTWWDENAVPRYCEFGPNETANIYRTECCLLLIRCQQCGREFKVCMSAESDRLEQAILAHEREGGASIHYGDPPNVGCCSAGATMNSVPVRVLEFWRRTRNPFGWERLERLEVDVWPDWMPRA